MPVIPWDKINWIAVIVAALVTFFLGAVWYTALFGKKWRELQGITDEQMKQLQAKCPPPVFLGTMFVAYFAISVAMALLVPMTGITSAIGGAALGFVLWLGIAAAIKLTDHIASGKPFGVYLIDSAFQLIYLCMIGAIIAAW